MTRNWKTVAIAEVAEIFDGPHATPAKTSAGPIFLGISNLSNGRLDLSDVEHLSEGDYTRWTRRVEPQAGDVVFSYETRLGQAAIIPPDLRCCLGRRMGLLRACDGAIDRRFLLYAYLGPQFQELLRSRTIHGSTVDRIPLIDMPTFPIEVPDALAEQRAIAAVLGALDDKIEMNRRTARALERLARAIFRAWFVDFEPVKAKAADAAGFPSMPQEMFDALPTRFVASEIGPVPEGWEVGALKELAALSKAQVKPQEHPKEVFDHFSIPAFDAGMRPVVEAGSAIKSNKFFVADGCVLLSKLNPRIPRVWLPPLARERRQVASTEFLVLVPNLASDRHYLYCQFQQTAFREELAQTATGTSNSHQRIKPTYLLAKAVILPPDPMREGFAMLADPLFALAAANQLESATLAEIRDYLLPKLLSGEVRVRDAERLAAEVV